MLISSFTNPLLKSKVVSVDIIKWIWANNEQLIFFFFT